MSPTGHPSARSQSNPESGVAIILSLLFLIIAVGLVTSGAMLMKATQDRSEVSFRVEAQAAQFARSGLTEGLSWFRRQTAQPRSSRCYLSLQTGFQC